MSRALVVINSASDRQRIASKLCANCGNTFHRDKRNTWAYWAKAKYCSAACAGDAWRRKKSAERPTLRMAWEKRVAKSSGCWLWRGIQDKDGYGILPYAGKQHRAHVVALALDGRPVPEGMYGCHRCDNPACVRPDHLYCGTPTQNMQDAMERDRTARGERSAHAKLTEVAVREIRAGLTDAAAVAKFGVTRSAVSMARRGVTWKNVR